MGLPAFDYVRDLLLLWVPTLRRTLLTFVLLCMAFTCHAPADAQDAKLPPGFQRIDGQYLSVVTDIPLEGQAGDELRELPIAFDAAVPGWCEVFDTSIEQIADWHAEAFVMLDRGRFKDAGLLPNHLPNFPYGFQLGDELWVGEQPSAYYRRHLLLHEGTHWFMYRRFGEHGPPWLMEGMAEWLGTHRWDAVNQKLEIGIIPKSKNEVPYWGRISLIQAQLAEGVAPSLETILRYDNTAHQHVEAYAWSWAAVLFLQHHPDTQEAFQKLLRQPMKSDSSMTRALFTRLKSKWPSIRSEWNAMLTDLEYGFDPSRGLLTLVGAKTANQQGTSREFTIAANRSWQSSGVHVEPGSTIALVASGEYSLGDTPGPWKCFPDGVTLEYYRGQPLGKLLMAVVEPMDKEKDFSAPLLTIAVGSGGELRIPTGGELHFRVNEAVGSLHDNEGSARVSITAVVSPR